MNRVRNQGDHFGREVVGHQLLALPLEEEGIVDSARKVSTVDVALKNDWNLLLVPRDPMNTTNTPAQTDNNSLDRSNEQEKK